MLQPRVAKNELSWVNRKKYPNPDEGVAAIQGPMKVQPELDNCDETPA
jgi:hypothetical protein